MALQEPKGARLSRRDGVGARLDPDIGTALRERVVAQDDSDELLRLLILAVLAKADRPMTGEQIAEEIAAPSLGAVRAVSP